MVNLLPKKDIATLYRSYYARLGVTLLFFISGAVFVGGILIVPAYVVSVRAADAGERYLAALEETVGLRERAGASDEMRALAEQLRILEQVNGEVSFAPFFTDALRDRSSEIRISGISFAKGEEALQVSIVGNAATRAALLSFADRLRTSGNFEGVSVPVSQFAADEDIPFSITATYRSLP